jgi:serine/threonine protein kinase
MGLTYLPETPKEEAAPCGISYDYSFISKYANQGDMICFLTNNSSMPLSLRLDLAEKLIKNLSILHSSHIAHRDLKPDNVLIHKEMEWQVWICDFGFATRKAYSSKKCGSRLYVPPEYDQNYFIDINHNFDCKNAETIQKFYNTFLTDIYTLGLTLFSLMSNQAYEEALIEYKENYAQETNELFIKCQHLEDFINYRQLLSNKMIEEYLQDYHSKHVEALKVMIKYYPHERMSLEQILQLWSD